MFGFLYHKKREEVKRLLHGRVNRAYARSVTAQSVRDASRGSFTEVVWVVPCATVATPDYSRVFPAVTKDLSTQGIAIIHNGPISEPRAIIGLKDETDPRFLLCTLQHCSPLGFGFYQIGFSPDEVVLIDPGEIDTMRETLAKYEAMSAPVAV